MKRISLIIMVLCIGWLTGCNKDDGNDGPDNPKENDIFSLMDGSIIINKKPDVTITKRNEFPISGDTESGISSSKKRTGIQTKALYDASGKELRGNDYRFKLVAQMSTLKIDGVDVQATDVKISEDGYAFVSYNEQGDPHRGGVVVYKYTIHDGSLETVTVDVEPVSSMQMSKAELSALDYYNGKLYMTGASSEPNFGYNVNRDGFNYAFLLVMELNANKTFKEDVDPVVVKLTSFQGTSIRVRNDRIYVTTGDGTNKTQGGLYVFKTDDCTLDKFISGMEHARSVDVDASGVFVMQDNPARVTKYDLNGENPTVIHQTENEAMQRDAKSEILAWNNYVFVAENESGLRMLFKDGGVNAALDRPGEDEEFHVTNSVSMNSDVKKNTNGDDVQSDMLFLANGGKGIYWYDIMKDGDGVDHIISCENNSILAGESANFVTSRGNIAFVADGLGGLKVLYIGFNKGDEPPPVEEIEACEDFMWYLYGEVTSLLPEGRSVFRSDADPLIKTLFSNAEDVPKYIEVLDDTELYISYLLEGAAWNNALGYFVIPGSVETDTEEYAYYNNSIRPNLCTTTGGVNILKDEYIIFQNIRDSRNNGPLTPGNTYQIGGHNRKFNAGDKVVFFMVPNGWNAQNNRVEVEFRAGAWNQVFFTHQYFNTTTGVQYSNTFRSDFRGIQHNTFVSTECNTIVMFFEDNHSSSDTDYNDVIVSISDNITGDLNTKIKLPKYTIGVGDNGRPVLAD